MGLWLPSRAFSALIVIAVGLILYSTSDPFARIFGPCMAALGIWLLITSFGKFITLFEHQLIVSDSGFRVGKKAFSFSDVQHLKFYNVVTTKRVNFVRTGENQKVTVAITLPSSPTVLKVVAGVGRGVSPYGSFGKAESQRLIEKYEIIRRHSFQARASGYLTSLEKVGYFIYNRKRIHRNGDVEPPKRKFNLISDRLLRFPFQIVCKKAGWSSIWYYLTGEPSLIIDTTVDADVFLYILDKYFNIRWD